MGRKRDRLDAVDWPPRLDVPAFHLDRLAASEAAGVGRVGDAVLPPGARGARRGPRCGHLVHAVRSAAARADLAPHTVPPSDFVPRVARRHALPDAVVTTGTDADAVPPPPPPGPPPPASAAFHPPPPPPGGGLTPAELAVVREARASRRSWADVAALLPWRSAAGVKKLYAIATGRAAAPPPRRGRPPSAADARAASAALVAVVVDDGAGAGVEGEGRVALTRRLAAAPPDTTVAAAHGPDAAAGAVFYGAASVVDGDDDGVVYEFEVGGGGGEEDATTKKPPRRGRAASPPAAAAPPPIPMATRAAHAACFNVGVTGADGSPLLSWARIVALYELPGGGGRWAETRVCVDGADFRSARAAAAEAAAAAAAAEGRPPPPPPPDLAAGLGPRELLARGGRVHSRLAAVEAECWLYEGALPLDGGGPPGRADDAWFWRTEYDPETLEAVVKREEGGAGG